jgi:hypothetical protein
MQNTHSKKRLDATVIMGDDEPMRSFSFIIWLLLLVIIIIIIITYYYYYYYYYYYFIIIILHSIN